MGQEFGGYWDDWGESVLTTSDGGYLFSGDSGQVSVMTKVK